MLFETMHDAMNLIINNYIDYGYSEDDFYFKYFLEILKDMWILIDKIGLKEGDTILDDSVYRLIGMYTFLQKYCKKRICKCESNEKCNLCENYYKNLHEIKDKYKHELIDKDYICTLIGAYIYSKKTICKCYFNEECNLCEIYNKNIHELKDKYKIDKNLDKIYSEFVCVALNKFLKPGNGSKQIEKKIQNKLYKELGGEIEVKTENGYIDLLTNSEIIEIKDGKLWKNAIGQILVYSQSYPKHNKRIHLFGIENNENINKICKDYNIKVTYDPNIVEEDDI